MVTSNNGANFHFDYSYFLNPQTLGPIILFQVGDLSCQGGHIVPEHRQYCYEISYIVSGKGYFDINQKSYFVQKGDIILNRPNELHRCRADEKEPFRYFYMGFNFAKNIGEGDGLAPIKKVFDSVKHPIVQDRIGIDTPFVKIFNEFIHLEKYSSHMIEMYLRQIIILAYRSFYVDWSVKDYSNIEADKSKHLVYRAINYIDTHLFDITELTEVAEALHYSYSYLSRIFAKEVGMTMRDYFNQKRFEKAVQWLKDGELNVTQVAEKLQYKSIHAFSKAFRKHFGVSPTEYQASMRMTKKDQYNDEKGQIVFNEVLLEL